MSRKYKNKIGRPPINWKDKLRKLEVAFKMGFSDREASSFAQIAPSTLYEYQKKNKEFSERKQGWKAHPSIKAKITIYKNLHDLKTAMWLLEHREPAFMPKRNINQRVIGKVSVEIVPGRPLVR